MQERGENLLKNVITLEDLAEKKAKIYARLLIDPAIAQDLERISKRHQERKAKLENLLYASKDKKGGEEDEARKKGDNTQRKRQLNGRVLFTKNLALQLYCSACKYREERNENAAVYIDRGNGRRYVFFKRAYKRVKVMLLSVFFWESLFFLEIPLQSS